MSVHLRSMNKISVCMATYNGQFHLQRQLESILKQLKDTDEVIISDDNSTDNTKQVIDAFNDGRIRFFINKGQNGPVGNFQNAIKQADGDYIFLADQDDVWLPHKVEVTIELLSRYDLVLSNCTVVDYSLNVIHHSFFEIRNSQEGFFRNLLRNSYMGCCMAFRRQVLSYSIPFPQKIYMHDWWIGLITELKGRVYFCDDPLILYVRHGTNASPTGENSYPFGKQLKNRVNMIMAIVSRFTHVL